MQGCSLFIQSANLPPGDRPSVMQPVYAVSEPAYQEMSGMGAACLCSVILPPGDCRTGTSLFMQCPNLPRHVFHSKSCLDICQL